MDYVRPVEFRSSMRYGILVPYLVFFFGAMLLMGLPMFRVNRLLWLVTVATTVLLLGSMSVAMFKGVGCEGADSDCSGTLRSVAAHRESKPSKGQETIVNPEPCLHGLDRSVSNP